MLRYFLRIVYRFSMALGKQTMGTGSHGACSAILIFWCLGRRLLAGICNLLELQNCKWALQSFFTQSSLSMYLFTDQESETGAVHQLCCIEWILFLILKSLHQSQVNKQSPKYTLRTFKLCWDSPVGQTSQVQTAWTIHYHLHVTTALTLYFSSVI